MPCTAGDRVVGSPAVKSGTIFFGSDDGKMQALDAATGSLDWVFKVPVIDPTCKGFEAEHGEWVFASISSPVD